MCSESNVKNRGVTLRFITSFKFQIGRYVAASHFRECGIAVGTHGLVRANLITLGILDSKSHVIRIPTESDIEYVRHSKCRLVPRPSL